jgi:imidazolonepropionase-like amidohydrolase
MHRIHRVAYSFLLVLLPALASAATVRAITGVNVVNLDGGPSLRDAVVIVTDDRITAVGPRDKVAIPPGAEDSSRRPRAATR